MATSGSNAMVDEVKREKLRTSDHLGFRFFTAVPKKNETNPIFFPPIVPKTDLSEFG